MRSLKLSMAALFATVAAFAMTANANADESTRVAATKPMTLPSVVQHHAREVPLVADVLNTPRTNVFVGKTSTEVATTQRWRRGWRGYYRPYYNYYSRPYYGYRSYYRYPYYGGGVYWRGPVGGFRIYW